MGTIFYSKRGYISIDLIDQILQFTIRAKRKVTEKIREILFVSKLKDIHSRIRMSTIVDAPMFWVNLPYGLTHSVFNSITHA